MTWLSKVVVSLGMFVTSLFGTPVHTVTTVSTMPTSSTTTTTQHPQIQAQMQVPTSPQTATSQVVKPQTEKTKMPLPSTSVSTNTQNSDSPILIPPPGWTSFTAPGGNITIFSNPIDPADKIEFRRQSSAQQFTVQQYISIYNGMASQPGNTLLARFPITIDGISGWSIEEILTNDESTSSTSSSTSSTPTHFIDLEFLDGTCRYSINVFISQSQFPTYQNAIQTSLKTIMFNQDVCSSSY